MTEQQKNEMQERARAYALCSSLDSNEQGKINRAYIEGAKWAKERFKFVLRDGLHYDAIPRDIDNYPLEYRENAKEYVLNTPHDYNDVEDTEDIAQLMECAYCQGMADRDNIGRWISVEEELPDTAETVLITEGKYVDLGERQQCGWFRYEGSPLLCPPIPVIPCEPTHWLPLPAAIVIPKDDALPEEGMPLPAPPTISKMETTHTIGTACPDCEVAAPLGSSEIPNTHKKGGEK